MNRIFKVLIVCVCLCSIPVGAIAEGPSLMQLLSPWRYPDAEMGKAVMADGAMVDAKGQRTQPSIRCHASMTTKASVDEVVAFYRKRLEKNDAPSKNVPQAERGQRRTIIPDPRRVSGKTVPIAHNSSQPSNVQHDVGDLTSPERTENASAVEVFCEIPTLTRAALQPTPTFGSARCRGKMGAPRLTRAASLD